MLRPAPLVLFLFASLLLLFPSGASAETSATAPAGGGLPALTVRVDLAAGIVVAGELKVPIALERAQLPGEGDVTVEAVPIGAGRRLVHVHVPARDVEGLAWEALLAGGQAQPLFAGVTGLEGGDPGERTGKAVRILPTAERSFVLVGDVREDLRLCGQDVTLLDPEAVYPASLDLRPATVQRLDAEQQAGAQRIVATDKGPAAEAPLGKLLVARGSSVPGSRGVELTDGNPSTVWREGRPGMGQGEFVVMAAPHDVPIARMQLVLTPPVAVQDRTEKADATDKDAAAPKTLYLVTGTETFFVTLPGDASLKPGEAYEVVFPKPIEASCLSLVLSDAYTHDRPHPVVGVAELTAYSEFDAPGATLDDVAKQLSGPRGFVAAQVLERAGAAALPAVERAYSALDAGGRALAIDVAASHDRCEQSAPLLARGLCETSGEAPRKSHEKLERCKAAVPVLAARLREDAASRTCVAPTLAVLAGPEALEPIADAMAATPVSDVSTRVVLRAAFAQAASGAEAPRLAAILGDAKRGPQARLEMMRAAGRRVADAPTESERTLTEVFAGAPAMRDRYVAMAPLGELARAGDAAAGARIAEALLHDADWPVRVRAAEVATGVAQAQASLLAASHDAEPRVREAALQSMSASLIPGAIDAARLALEGDRWSFVKVQAIGVLGRSQPSGDVDRSLGDALKDASPRVRGAAVVALGRRRAAQLHEAVRERLDDPGEDADVRASAARVLGALCDASSADRLTEYARKLGVPGSPEDEQQVALGALEGLAAMQPPDLADRLAPLRSSTALPSVSNAAERALKARSLCR